MKKYKILLVAINAKYIHSNLAVYCLSAYAKKHGFDVEIAEYTINNQSEHIVADIYKRKPDFIGFSSYIWNISFVNSVARDIKKILPSCSIWLGGPEVSYEINDKMGKYSFADGIMIGEGEITFAEVLAAYCETVNKEDLYERLSSVRGISYREHNLITEAREYMNMDDIPFVYSDLENFKNRIIYYETSRGCPFDCAYCMSSIDKRVRFRSLDLVKNELKFFLDNKVSQVKFVDRTFNCNRQHTLEIWKYILENDNGITNFHFEISADLINEEELELISKMRPRLIQLEIGVQSTNEMTLKSIHRNTDFKKLSKVVSKIKAMKNIHQHLDLIAGLPYENYESFKQSFNEVYALLPEQLQLGFLKVLSGADLKEKSKKYGIVYKDDAPYEVLFTDFISYEEILKLKSIEEMVEEYYNSGQFCNIIKYLEHFFNNPFEMYEYMANYYEDNNIMYIGHARISRYIILLEICEKVGCDKDCVTEIITHDLYLRENLKNRPEFAKDLSEYKDIIRKFYMNNKGYSEFLKGYDKYNSKQIARMTHIEHFSIDIKKTVESGKRVPFENYVLYDYLNRNPVNYDANSNILEEKNF